MADHVEMSGSGQVSVGPDLAVLRLSLDRTEDAAADAIRGSAEAATSVGRWLREQGIEGADLQTSGVRLQRGWDHQAGRESGYLAQHTLAVLVREPGRLASLLSGLAERAGDALRIDGLQWALADPAEGQARARELAWSDAESKARQVAELAGLDLGPVVSVDEGSPEGGPSLPREAKLAMADAGSVEPGEGTVTARLRVRWQLTGRP